MKNSKFFIKLAAALFIISILFISYNNSAFPKRKNTNEAKTTSQEEKIPLVFRITWKAYSGRGEAIQKIVNSYNNINQDGFEIKMMDGDEDINALESRIDGNEPADVYVLPYRFVRYFGDKKKIEDLTMDFEKEKEFFYKELWDLGLVGQKNYGIPWVGHSICLIYNKNLLEKADVDPNDIRSLVALATACEKVEANTPAKGIGLVGANHNDVSWMVNQFIYGYGSSLVNPEGTKVTINNEKSKAAIDFYKNTLGAHAQETWVDDTGVEVMNYFRKQQVAFEFQGLWGVTDIWKNGNPFEVGVIPLEDIGLYSEVGPLMLAIQPKLSEEKRKAAISFIQFLISKEAQEMIMAGEYSPEHDYYYPFRIPVRKDLTGGIIFDDYRSFLPFLEGFSKPSIDVPVPKWQTIKDKYYAIGLHQVFGNKISIEAFLQNLETEGNKALMEEK